MFPLRAMDAIFFFWCEVFHCISILQVSTPLLDILVVVHSFAHRFGGQVHPFLLSLRLGVGFLDCKVGQVSAHVSVPIPTHRIAHQAALTVFFFPLPVSSKY